MRGEGNGPGGQYDYVLMDERFTAALAAALELAAAKRGRAGTSTRRAILIKQIVYRERPR